jgi:DNA-binding MarR family transcriptional regulator
MDTIALAGRLRANPNNVVRLLKQLEARGVVRCVEMRRGPVASEWTLVREQERRAS